jgi:hypothetical protein
MGKSRHLDLATIPLREELEALARHYHHLQNEHKRAAPNSAVRRRIEDRLLDTRERFDRVLGELVPPEDLQRAWREHLHNRAPAPPGPPVIRPLLFKGISEVSGSVAEIRGRGDELEVRVDGDLVERVAGGKDFAATGPPLRWRLNGTEFLETSDASDEALNALSDFLDDGKPPPWDHASELLADGLIDTHFALTPRGRRALASRGLTAGRL